MAETARIFRASEKYLLLLLAENSRIPELAIEIIGRIKWLEEEKKCWFIQNDWSHYTSINGRIAHRQSFVAFNGELIFNHEVCHHCDRPGCVNPFHLFQGTHSDNIKDAKNKGRIRPVRIIKSKNLTNEAIVEAKKIIEIIDSRLNPDEKIINAMMPSKGIKIPIGINDIFGSVEELKEIAKKYEPH